MRSPCGGSHPRHRRDSPCPCLSRCARRRSPRCRGAALLRTDLYAWPDRERPFGELALGELFARGDRDQEAIRSYDAALKGLPPGFRRTVALTMRIEFASRLGDHPTVIAHAIELLDAHSPNPEGNLSAEFAADSVQILGGLDRVALRTTRPWSIAAIAREIGRDDAQRGDLFAAAKAWRRALDAAPSSLLAPHLTADLTAAYDAIGDHARAEQVWNGRTKYVDRKWVEAALAEAGEERTEASIAEAEGGIKAGLRPRQFQALSPTAPPSDRIKPTLQGILQRCFERALPSDNTALDVSLHVDVAKGKAPSVRLEAPKATVQARTCIERLVPNYFEALEQPFDVRVSISTAEYGKTVGWLP